MYPEHQIHQNKELYQELGVRIEGLSLSMSVLTVARHHVRNKYEKSDEIIIPHFTPVSPSTSKACCLFGNYILSPIRFIYYLDKPSLFLLRRSPAN